MVQQPVSPGNPDKPPSSSTGQLILTAILWLLPLVLKMKPWQECLVWIVIAGLSGHLVWQSEWTKERFPKPVKIAVSLVTAVFISWQALDAVKNDKGQASIMTSAQNEKLTIQKFELHPFVEGQPVLVNVVIENISKMRLSIKSYDVTAIWQSPAGEQQDKELEDFLYAKLDVAMREVKAVSQDVPISPSKFYLTLDGPILSHIQKEGLMTGQMRFYFLGALVQSDGATLFYCSYTQTDGVMRLCRRQRQS